MVSYFTFKVCTNLVFKMQQKMGLFCKHFVSCVDKRLYIVTVK